MSTANVVKPLHDEHRLHGPCCDQCGSRRTKRDQFGGTGTCQTCGSKGRIAVESVNGKFTCFVKAEL